MYASNQTTNYDLSQWLPTDPVHHEDFNGDNAKLDAALAAKADAVDMVNLNQTVAGLTSTVSGHTDALDGKGNCEIFSITYTGTGQYGEDHPAVINFDYLPLLVWIIDADNTHSMVMIYGSNRAQASNNFDSATVSWTRRSVTWYANAANAQMNSSGKGYALIALLACV